MKYLIIAIVHLISLSGFSQINKKALLAEWKCTDIFVLPDSTSVPPENPLTISFFENDSFKIVSSETIINGTWVLRDSTLTLTGIKEGETYVETNIANVYSVDKEKLTWAAKLERETLLVNFQKIK
jgi:hypothetical protein